MRDIWGVAALGAALLLVGPGCVDGANPDEGAPEGPVISIDVAALSLAGVGDVVWDLEVVNGRTPTPDVVWQRRISSTGYGDGAGSASYVGPCDADPTVSTNTVRVWVVGVYSGQVTALGTFGSGAANGAAGPALSFQNPTATGPLTRTVVCQQNADVAVQFDVALMRPAQQGFFDIAVNFNNIFCSAKFDCCNANAVGGGCASDIALLFNAAGSRASTMVLGFACTAGPRADVVTNLYLDALALDCTSPTAGSFAADLRIDPSGPGGNKCSAGDVGGGACAAVTSPGGLDADTYLYQVGVYQGEEQLTSGGVQARKSYWNVALGVNRKVAAGPGIEDCWLMTRGTADDTNGSSVMNLGTVAAGAVYPYVQWQVNLASCDEEPLTFGDAGAMVRTEYTTTGGTGTTFAFGYGPGTPDTVGDGLDQNGDGADGIDADRDGNASVASGGTDCDDQSASVTYGTATCPALTCASLMNGGLPGATSGHYFIRPTGAASAFNVYCDLTTDGGGWALVFKKSSGVVNDPNGLWTTGNANATNLALADRDQETLDYAVPVYQQAWSAFTQARVEAVTGGTVRAWVRFNTSGVDAQSWFVAGRVTGSSYTDLGTESFNYFSIPGDTSNSRHWFISRNYGGCAVDQGWLVANGANAPCSWNTAYTVRYSAATTQQNWTSGNTLNAGALAVWLR